MTLTIADVEKWEPDHLTTAGDRAGTISTNLDGVVRDGSDRTRALGWTGVAADAANMRMDTEQTRAGTISTALHELQNAFTSQVGNLKNVKANVLELRRQAIDENPIGFEVADNGEVTATKRIKRIRTYEDVANVDRLVKEEEGFALERTRALATALQQAESVAKDANTAVTQAVSKLEAAYGDLGDPKSGTTPAPTLTTPAAVSNPAPATPSRPNYAMSGNHNGGNSSSGMQYSGSPISGGPVGPPPTGDKAKWIQEALKVLKDMGYDTSDPNLVADISEIIKHESGDNPQAFNGWDSNAAAGTPSKGLMQTIDSTFNAHKAPGHDDIWNPVDNIVAGVRYATDRYGSVHNVPGLVSMRSGGAYQGY
jgi:hypothetical protein